MVQEAVQVPVLHVIDPCAKAILESDMERVVLFGTLFTTEGNFYLDRLLEKFGIQTIILGDTNR